MNVFFYVIVNSLNNNDENKNIKLRAIFFFKKVKM